MFAVGSPLVNYKLAVQSRDRLLAQFEKTPTYSRAVQYYRDNIGKVTSVEDLLKDRKLLQVALAAFQLEEDVDAKGKIRKLLTEDPTDKRSLAQRLIDPRYRQFAQAFASLRNDGGKTVRDPTTIGTILQRFQTNEFEKFIGESDPTVREALYFKRTVEDTIDVKNLNELMTSWKKAPGVAEAVKYYRDNVKNVTSVRELLTDEKLLRVALSAYQLEGLLGDKATAERLLTENPDAPGALAKLDQRYMNFAKAFFTLRYDGGAQIHVAGNIDTLVAAYERSEFEQILSLKDDAAKAAFARQAEASAAPAPSASYYRAHVGEVTRIDDLLGDDQLLGVALGAFGLERLAADKASVFRLLTEDPADTAALAQTDSRFLQFATHFASLKSDGGAQIRDAADIEKVAGAFAAQHYGTPIGVAAAGAYYRDNVAEIVSVAGFVNDGALLRVALTAFGMPELLADKATVTQLLTEDRNAAGALAQSDPRYMAFATEFESLRSDGGAALRSDASLQRVLGAFEGKLFQHSPTNAEAAAYYRANIGKVTDVPDLIADGQLLQVVLAAFDLPELIHDKATVKRLLTEFNFLPTALARQDPRYMRLAKAFESLQLDRGAAIRSEAGIASVLEAFENRLLESPGGRTQLPNYYRDTVGKVTSVAGFLADEQLLHVALGAFNLGEFAGDKAKVQLLLTEDPNAPGALAKTDPRYGAFAAAFRALASDGGARLRSAADIDAVLGAYARNEHDRLFKLAHPATRTGLFGSTGEKTIADLLAEFQATTAYTGAIAQYRERIGRATTVDRFLADKEVLGVALSAFRIEALAETPAVIRALLTQDPAAPGALAQTDPRYMQFAQEFAEVQRGRPPRDKARVEHVLAEYTVNQFQKSLDANVRQAASSSGKLTDTQLLADRTLAKVTREALYLPNETGALELDQQKAAMKRAGLDPAKLQEPAGLEKFIRRFLAKAALEQQNAQQSLVSQLFQPAAPLGGGGGINLLA